MSHYQQAGNLQEQIFDELVALTAKLCRAPIAFISLLEKETIWFKHATGWTGATRLPHDFTLCSIVIREQTPTLFPDLQQAPCHRINSAQIEALGLRFYLGVPLRTTRGRLFGVLAILDQLPRQPRPADQPFLEHIAALISTLLDFYAAAHHTFSWLTGVGQLYESIGQSMNWMHSLADRAQTTEQVSSCIPSDYQEAISQEARKLAALLQQHMDLANKPAHLSPKSAWLLSL